MKCIKNWKYTFSSVLSSEWDFPEQYEQRKAHWGKVCRIQHIYGRMVGKVQPIHLHKLIQNSRTRSYCFF
jgi:hypothetical protein